MIGRHSVWHSYLTLIFRCILGAIFIYASWDKLLSPADFARVVYNYRLLPEIFINIFTIILPWIELICGSLIIIGFLKKGSILIINLLLIAFFLAMAINLYRGIEIGCGCFSIGNINDKISIFDLIRDLLMIGMGFYVYVMTGNESSPRPVKPPASVG